MATSPNATQITPPRVSIIDERTGAVSREWYRWFYSLYNIVGGGLGVIPVASGGTGLSTIPTNGQLLIGNGTGYTLNTLGVGAGISVTNGSGTITVANTGVLSNIAGTGISVSSATGNVTVANTGVLSIIAGSGISVSSATGNVTVANTGVLSFSGGATGLTPATATTGAVTLAGRLAIANGGTNSTATPTTYGIAYGTGTAYAFTAAGTTGQVLTATTGGAPTWVAPATSGTVTSVSVVSANGLAGTVATATTTPAITLSTTVTGLLKGNGTAISAAVANVDYVPLSTVITKTADYTITGTDTWIINNKTGSALTLTFPAASSWTGRYITVKNMQAQLVNSASSNIVPLDSTTAGTAILLDVIGNWATMVSDGTNWVIMQAASNNNLLLE